MVSAKGSANGDQQQEQTTLSNRPNSSEDVTAAASKTKESSIEVKAGDEVIKISKLETKEDMQQEIGSEGGGN